MTKEPEQELWAITDTDGKVVWSRGGSSSSRRLMVYPSEKKAEAAMNNAWTKQAYSEGSVEVRLIYSAKD